MNVTHFLTWTISFEEGETRGSEVEKIKRNGRAMMEPIYLNLDYTTRNHAYTNDMFLQLLMPRLHFIPMRNSRNAAK